MNRRLFFASLVVVAVLSGIVVAEAERNYAAVTSSDDTEASVANVTYTDEGLDVAVSVRNTMTERLRVQFAHVEIEHANGTDGASEPYKGHLTLAPGKSTFSVWIPARQLSDGVGAGDTVTVSGYVSVEVFNGYQFEVPIRPRDVTL